MKTTRFISLIYLILLLSGNLHAKEITVKNSSELRDVLRNSEDVDMIYLQPGEYTGGIYVSGLSGRAEAPVTIRRIDPNNPPVFSGGGGQAFHFSDCSHITLAGIKVQGYPGNGINIDDGGTFETPSHHMTMKQRILLLQETGL